MKSSIASLGLQMPLAAQAWPPRPLVKGSGTDVWKANKDTRSALLPLGQRDGLNHLSSISPCSLASSLGCFAPCGALDNFPSMSLFPHGRVPT